MKIAFVNMFYPPHTAQVGFLMEAFVKHMAARKHRVTVFTGRVDYMDSKARAPVREVDNLVEIIRVWGTGSSRKNAWTRLLDYGSFFLLLVGNVLKRRDIDVVVCLTAPPLVDVVGWMHRFLYGSKLVLLSLDNHPESLVRMGLCSRDSLRFRTLYALRRFVAKHSALAIAPDREMVRVLQDEGYTRTLSLPYWDNPDEYPDCADEVETFRRQYNWENKFVALYLGNMGIPHEFETFLEAACLLKERDDILWAFIGGGAMWPNLQEAVRKRRLNNCQVNGYIEKSRTNIALRAAHIALICLNPSMVGVGSPGKLVPALICGRPIAYVGASESEVGRAAAYCGKVVPSGGSTDLAAFITEMADFPEWHRKFEKKAREYYTLHYNYRQSLDLFAETVEEIVPENNPVKLRKEV